ncbi:MAG: HD domain-containing protein [Planctomycetota bacterium]|nr:MAG: HD domain-containing protein [Planctomycetota bacterium]
MSGGPPDPARPLWQEAASFALRAHAGQTRHDGVTPYAAHAVRVALTVRDLFGCEDETAVAAALLHDVIEDTPADYDDLHERFGAAVADTVAALTKDMRRPEPQREAEYDRALAAAGWRAALVKLADTYDNLCDLSAPGKRQRMLDRCRRALAIAGPLRDEHPAVARGSALLTELVQRESARG